MAEQVVVEIISNYRDRASAGLQNLRDRLDKVRVGIGPVNVSLTQMVNVTKRVAVAVAAATTAITGMVLISARLGTEIRRSSVRVGESVENLSRLRFAYAQAGLELEDLDETLREVNLKLGEALAGEEASAEGFRLLGLDIRKILALKPAQRIEEIADAVAGLGTQSEKTAALARLLGDDLGPKLLPILAQGRQGLQDYARDAENLGIVVSSQFADDSAAFNAALGRLGATFRGFGINISSELLPVFTAFLTEHLGPLRSTLNDLVPLVVQFAETMVGLAGAALRVGNVFVQAIIPPFQTLLNLISSIGGFVTNAVNSLFQLLPPVRELAEELGFIGRSGGIAQPVDYNVLSQYDYSPNIAAIFSNPGQINPGINLGAGDVIERARGESTQRLLRDILLDPVNLVPGPGALAIGAGAGAVATGRGWITRLLDRALEFLGVGQIRGVTDNAGRTAISGVEQLAGRFNSSADEIRRLFENNQLDSFIRNYLRDNNVTAQQRQELVTLIQDATTNLRIAAADAARPGLGRRLEQGAFLGGTALSAYGAGRSAVDIIRAFGYGDDALTYRVLPYLAGHDLGEVPFVELLDQPLSSFDSDAIRDLQDEVKRGGAAGQIAQNLLDGLAFTIREYLTPQNIEEALSSEIPAIPNIPGTADTRSIAERLGLGLFNPAIRGVQNALSFTQSNVAFGGSTDAIFTYRQTLRELLAEEADNLRQAFRSGQIGGDEFTEVFGAVAELANSLKESIDEVAMRLRVGIYDATIGRLQTALGIERAEVAIFGRGSTRSEERDLLSAIRDEARDLQQSFDTGAISEELFIEQYTQLGNLAASLNNLVEEQRAQRVQTEGQPIIFNVQAPLEGVTQIQGWINNGRITLAPGSAGRPY